VPLAIASGVLAIGACLVWTWELDRPSQGEVEVAKGMRLPTYITGPLSHSWWAMVVLMLVGASLYVSYFFSYLYLWTVSPEVWAPAGAPAPPSVVYPGLSAVMLILGAGCMLWCGRILPESDRRHWGGMSLLVIAAALMVGAVILEIWGHWQTGLRPTDSSYGAMVYMASVLEGQIAFVVTIMCLFAVARLLTRQLTAQRRVTFDNAALLYYYAVGQGLFGLLLIHGFPRQLG